MYICVYLTHNEDQSIYVGSLKPTDVACFGTCFDPVFYHMIIVYYKGKKLQRCQLRESAIMKCNYQQC